MRRIILWGIGSALLSFIVFFFIFLFFHDRPSPTPLQWYAREEPMTQSTPQPLTYTEYRQAEKDRSRKDQSLYQEALKKQDEAICREISSPILSQDCQDAVIRSRALSQGDMSLCDTLTGTSLQSCRGTVLYRDAIEKRDISICDMIADPALQGTCREASEQTLLNDLIKNKKLTRDRCEEMRSKWRDTCIERVTRLEDEEDLASALRTGNKQYCEMINDSGKRDMCHDRLIEARALTSGDLTLCEEMRDNTRRASCIERINVHNESLRLQSYIATGTLGDCETLTSGDMQRQCHDMIILRQVRETGTTELCSRLFATGMIDRCEQIPRM